MPLAFSSSLGRNRLSPRPFALTLAAVLVLAGCRSGDELAPMQVVELDAGTAARAADSIRQQVSVEVADGLEVSLWASEALVADAIALAIDDDGRAYVTRTNRQKNSEFDIRGYQHWMLESISWESVEDRRDFLRREFAPERSEENSWLEDLNGDGSHDWRDLAVEKEQVYRIEDRSGDGVADRSQLYVEDFHTEVTDVAGAVLPVGDDVYVGVAPDLWRLSDRSENGTADFKESISHGYAVHIGFSGHGMSGLTMGPDGRLYWSIGDIGLNVVGPDGTRHAYPHQGAILRSEPDGSNFEVFAAGIRNTHEFVFDAYGNLISVDNDGDHPGEQERIVYLVDGSDSGWRANWQYGKYIDPDNNSYKVWMDEELYKPRFEGQAAYILPPIANYHSGPAGMAYNPGTALGERWQDRFFVAEFTGSPARSRVFAFDLEPEGAGFRFAGEEVVTRGLLATGLDFGPDGALYAADWLEGWDTSNKGRIWKIDDPAAASSPLRAETKALLAAEFDESQNEELFKLLRHPDLRVRQKAQFELARRGDERTLLEAARQGEHQLVRIHGLWGLWQLARRDLDEAESLTAFLTDPDPEVRAQAAKILGDVRYEPAAGALLPLLSDEEARVRFFATEALGRIGHRPALEPIVELLAENDDRDVYLRHGGAIALARIGDVEALTALSDHPSRAVRLAAVVALRRLRAPALARFLTDEDPYVVTEAARAINDDGGIEEALPALAAVLEEERFTGEPLLRRAINANQRVGTDAAARRVAAFAARAGAAEPLRVEALEALATWPNPSVVDRVDGVHHGSVTRDPAIARAALEGAAEQLLADGSVAVRAAAAQAAGRLGASAAMPTLFRLAGSDPAPEVRIAALRSLHAARYEEAAESVRRAFADPDREVRMTAIDLVAALDLPPEAAVELLEDVIRRRTVEEKQQALAVLGELGSAPAQAALGRYMDRLAAGEVAPEIQLDVMEAVAASGSDTLATRLAEYRAAHGGGDGAASRLTADAFQETLEGGDVDRGRNVFYDHPGGQCSRCHVMDDWGGDVGPELTDVGARMTRAEILQSLIEPSARIAPGYGTVVLSLSGGETVRGVLREETPTHLTVATPEGETRAVPTSAVTERQDGPSSMPPMGTVLTRRELRDLVAFLSSRKGE